MPTKTIQTLVRFRPTAGAILPCFLPPDCGSAASPSHQELLAPLMGLPLAWGISLIPSLWLQAAVIIFICAVGVPICTLAAQVPRRQKRSTANRARRNRCRADHVLSRSAQGLVAPLGCPDGLRTVPFVRYHQAAASPTTRTLANRLGHHGRRLGRRGLCLLGAARDTLGRLDLN